MIQATTCHYIRVRPADNCGRHKDPSFNCFQLPNMGLAYQRAILSWSANLRFSQRRDCGEVSTKKHIGNIIGGPIGHVAQRTSLLPSALTIRVLRFLLQPGDSTVTVNLL